MKELDSNIHNIEMYKRVFNNSIDSMIIFEDDKFIDCNESALKLFNYENKSDLLHIHPSELSPQTQADGESSYKKAQEILDIVLEKRTYSFEWLYKKSDGEVFWCEVSLTNISSNGKHRFFVILKNINDRKNMESRLLDLNNILMQKTKKLERYKKLISENVLHSQTDLDGIITDVSDAFCKLSGYDKDELLGQSHTVLRHPDTPPALYKNLWETLQKGKQWSGKIKNMKKDGSEYWVHISITPEYDEDGSIHGYLAVRSNISSRVALKELNENLEQTIKEEVENNRQKELQLFAASKLASMGEMIANIAHQWRQPLGTISAIAYNVKLLNELDNLNSEEISSHMDEIAEHSRHLSDTIDTFRNFLKDDKEKVKISIQEILNETLHIVDTLLKDNHIKLINETDYDHPIYITASKGELSQVLINIINNAKDIILEKKPKKPFIKIALIQIASKAIITIEDNAGGIPDDVLPKIFDPYFTTKHQTKGTGLGLHMSYKIINDSMHGKLYAKNTNYGAKFFVELPL